mgnify:CR=1 FL=1
MSENLLAKETSPYLLQHKDNPVHWQPWNKQALNQARDLNKPILLSIGYSACHWCHVMAHESFENTDIANLMNDLFINIKVDREERPDLDNIYQSALQLMGEQGGWPLTIFCDAQGKPFWGGTYFPPVSKFGRPGFSDVLQQISDVYTQDPEKISHNSDRIVEALANSHTLKSGPMLERTQIDQAANSALEMMDMSHGGTLGAPKFPQPIFLKFLWSQYLSSQDQRFLDAVTTTLDCICEGGIYDHIGGGFSRYSVDEVWLVPHFEKMLYDNAMLIELMGEVWRVTKSDLYATRIAETIDWMLGDLRIEQGPHRALASARDADSEGIEGKFYVWTLSQIKSILGDNADLFAQVYNMTEYGNWPENEPGANIAHRNRHAPDLTQIDENIMRECRSKLLAVRDDRIPPLRDDKVLVDWNALAISGLVRCASLLQNPAWLDAARNIHGFIKNEMTVAGRLVHSWCRGETRYNATLDDYANMTRASLDLYQTTCEPEYLSDAQKYCTAAHDGFWDTENGGYFLSSSDTDDVFMRNKVTFDNPTPSGNGVMLEVLSRLLIITGESDYGDQAQTLLQVLTPADPRSIINQPSLAMGIDIYTTQAQVIIALVDNDNPQGQNLDDPLLQCALRESPASYVVTVTSPGQVLPEGHPASGKQGIDGKAAAYICRNQSCALPITDVAELAEALSEII